MLPRVPLHDCAVITALFVLTLGPFVPEIVNGAEVLEQPAASDTVSV